MFPFFDFSQIQTSFDSKSGKKTKTVKQDAIDPLSQASSSGGDNMDAIDPLSMFAAETATTVAKNKSSVCICCSHKSLYLIFE